MPELAQTPCRVSVINTRSSMRTIRMDSLKNQFYQSRIAMLTLGNFAGPGGRFDALQLYQTTFGLRDDLLRDNKNIPRNFKPALLAARTIGSR